MSDAARDALFDMLAHHWVRITAPISLDAIGSIMHDSAHTSPQLWCTERGAISRSFWTVQLIPQFPRPYTECLDPSMELRPGPRRVSEHWRYLIGLQRSEIALYYPQSDPSVIVMDGLRNKYTLGELIQCADTMEHLAHVAASLDPLEGRPAMSLVHVDFACWRNVLLSEDRQSVRGIVDWDDAVVLPRDLAALYPIELTLEADCRPDPEDVYAVPPDTLDEDTGLWEAKITETHRREKFRETVAKLDPNFAALYMDRRARFRRRVNDLVVRGWPAWLWHHPWVVNKGPEEARVLTALWRA